MRIFKKYNPGMIVKHVRTFFKGRFYIQGRGAFEFDNGTIVMPSQADEIHESTVIELNKAIKLSKSEPMPLQA